MIDHHVSKFFEALFWIGALLTFASFFYPRWFMITIIIGILLMTISAVREGFSLRRAKTIVGVIKKNETKIIHRFILLAIIIAVFVYILLKQTVVYDLMIQFYDLTKSPTTSTWWVFVLMGIIIGLILLFIIIHMLRIEYGKLTTWLKLKYPKLKLKTPKEALVQKREERPIPKKVTIKKPNFVISLWNKILTSLQKKLGQRRIKRLKKQQENLQKELEQTRAKQLKEQKAKSEELKKKKLEEQKPTGKYATVKIKPGILSRITWEEKSFWGKILTPLQKKLEEKRIRDLKEQQTRIEEIKKKKLEELKEKSKKEKIVVTTEIKHPLMPRLFITLFILAITVIIILHRKGKFSIEDPVSAAILGLIFGLFLLYIFKNVYKARQAHHIKIEKKEQALEKIKQKVIAKASKYETDVDKFYDLINEVESLTLTEAADVFGVSKEQAEEWGKILESHGMIELEYPAMGELRLCKKKLKATE